MRECECEEHIMVSTLGTGVHGTLQQRDLLVTQQRV